MPPKIIATIVIACVIAALFIAVTASEIIKKKKGKSSCSCGGNCGACGLCHSYSNKSDTK